jgi:hypothetical protein
MSDVDKRLTSLVRKLNTRRIIGWQEEFRLGKTLYDHLVRVMIDGDLTSHQIANALVVLHRLRMHGSDEQVFEFVRAGLGHETKRVRNQAVALTIGTMREHKWQSPYYSDEILRDLRTARDLGVDKDYAALIGDLLVKGPSALELR